MTALSDIIKRTDTRTRIVLVISTLALLAVLSLAGVVASRRHFVVLTSDLDDGQRVAVEKALAGGSMRYRISQPPAPFVVYVDESELYRAQNLVALADALEPEAVGIATGAGGASELFRSSGEREQAMLKREWQEMERQLEELDFVSKATVTTSVPVNSPIRRDKPLTVSVTLKLSGVAEPSRAQADMVAKLVRFRFDVPPENLVISDQTGRALYDPTKGGETEDTLQTLLEHARQYDQQLELKVNGALTHAFGPDKALVTVTSEWDHEQSTSVSETVEPTKKAITERTTSSESTQPAPIVGGPAGVSSNIDQGFGVETAAVPDASVAPGNDFTKTEETEKTYDTSRSRVQTVRSAPLLRRLSVSLTLDESLAGKRDEIEGLVKVAAGFDASRNDQFSTATTTFVTPEEAPADEGAGATGAAPSSAGPSESTRFLVERGIEIVAAIFFLLVLVTTLRGARKAVAAATAASTPPPPSEPEPELLARHQIEELVRTDPRRVGEVLSRWADEGSTVRS
jgi:flagellar biosynthesis/type III secretory pathway M-ring protein FliF/YscJ